MSDTVQLDAVQRMVGMAECDVECPHCHGLTAHRGYEMPSCVHCGNQPTDPTAWKRHKVDRKADVPRYAP